MGDAALAASGQVWEEESLRKAIEASKMDVPVQVPVLDAEGEFFHAALQASMQGFDAQLGPQEDDEALALKLSLDEASRVAALEAEEQRQLKACMAASLAIGASIPTEILD